MPADPVSLSDEIVSCWLRIPKTSKVRREPEVRAITLNTRALRAHP
jgi:hypothetical protein